MKPSRAVVCCATLTIAVAIAVAAKPAALPVVPADALTTTSPIKHIVVIFDENISFDHYFGTYPVAANPPDEPAFTAAAGTPRVNGLSDALMTHNPNLINAANADGASNPFRLDRTQAATADQGHAYTAEQRAYDGGRMDLFPRYTGKAGSGGSGAFNTTGLVMGYFDGNTVTALWNYAQHFAMSDNAYGDQYGPSTPGALGLVAGQTNGVTVKVGGHLSAVLNDGQDGATLIGDIDPAGDTCSSATRQVRMSGRNIGDLLSRAGVSWGWFQGGFDLTRTNANGTAGCKRSSRSDQTNEDARDYVPHHEPFQYYASTANPAHARPASLRVVGTARDGGANHQYDLHDFFDAVRAGNYPAVVFLKAAAFENAHAGNSDPIDEQHFVVRVVNFLEQQPDWRSTAIIIAYDDSDGWYDHQMAPLLNGSFDSTADQLSGPGTCGARGSTPQLDGVAGKPVNGRCGPGTRQPLLVISPWAKMNYVDHVMVTQSSIIHFIEDNWLGGARLGGGSFDATGGAITGMFDFHRTPGRPLFLDPALGTALAAAPPGTPEQP